MPKYSDQKLKNIIDAWSNKVNCSLDDDNNWQTYKVTGDNRVPSSITLPRVTSISGMINKPELNNWIVNQTLSYIRDNLFKKILANSKSSYPKSNKEVLKDVITQASASPIKTRDTAGNFGTECHDLLKNLSDNPNTEIPEKFQHVSRVWSDYMNESGLISLATEQSLYYHKDGIGFAGTFDYLGVNTHGDIIIMDYKTSNGIYDDMALQLSAYCMAFKFIFGKFIEDRNIKGVVMKLPKTKDGQLEVAIVNDLESQFEIFKGLALRKKISESSNTWQKE